MTRYPPTVWYSAKVSEEVVNIPALGNEEVRMFLPEHVHLISKPRMDHEYPYFEEFESFLR